MYFADLHIHSKYSRATAKSCDLPNLALWAQKKGISLVGTGDFTHPGWRAEIQDQLVPAENGLFRLRPDLEAAVENALPAALRNQVRFLLTVEISTIYKKGDRTRKVHHLVLAPGLEAVLRMSQRLTRIGNLHSDGRPILGLDSRDLLEIVLEADPAACLIPAHIWTPWFAVLGSKSGFDRIEDCYGDLADHIFAVETGLSSDPPMNWRLSSLDRYRLVSNSDAHSPQKLGREATAFEGPMGYETIQRALRTGEGYQGTVEFFPEEGKYHLDGHRKCSLRLRPEQTRAAEGRCPSCGGLITVGVMHRVEALADRPEGTIPTTAGPLRSLVPLTEILGEILGIGPTSKGVERAYETLLQRLGPELGILQDVPPEELRSAHSPLLAEALTRLRQGRVIRDAGYDGEYGTIRLFEPHELCGAFNRLLFSKPPPAAPTAPGEPTSKAAPAPSARGSGQPPERATPDRTAPFASGDQASAAASPSAVLDPQQQLAVEHAAGPLLVSAGPGSGKTRVLTQRIALLVGSGMARAEECLAITFTRRAADELGQRLAALLPGEHGRVTITTFHGFGLRLLQENREACGLPEDFRVASTMEAEEILLDLGVPEAQARRMLGKISRHKRTRTRPGEEALQHALGAYEERMRERGLLDFDDLVIRAADLLAQRDDLAETYRKRFRFVSVDEYQDVDEQQVRLLRPLVPAGSPFFAIGDPDQAIYGFRGGDVRIFQRFADDFPGAKTHHLERNYRSALPIIGGALAMVSRVDQTTRPLLAMRSSGESIRVHAAPSEKAEAEFVVQQLEQLIGGHSFFSLDSGRSQDGRLANLSFSDFAVLYRTDAQADALIEALSRSGIPFQKRSHERLADLPAVRAVTRRLREEPSDGEILPRLQALRDGSGDRSRSRAIDPAALEAAIELLAPLARAAGADLPRFLSEIALGAQVDSWDPRADRVSLLTLHASKGLEFPVVFVVGCEEGLLPLVFDDSEQSREEERRLFFVGMTRARDALLLSHARRRLWRGQVRDRSPSSFLEDIPSAWLEHDVSTLPRRKHKAPPKQLPLL